MIEVEFRDPGMYPKKVSVQGETDLGAALAAEVQHYTRAFVRRPGDARKNGEKWVRALGSPDWRRWADMSSMERHSWSLQDRGD